MDFFKKNRAAAALILAAAIVLSVVLGTVRSISSIESTVEKRYTEKDKYGETVSGTVEMLKLHISTFISEYEAVLGNCGEISVLRECLEALPEGDGIADDTVNIDDVRNCATLMHQRLDRSDSYSAEAKAAFAGIDNDISILKKYDAYNKAAKKYNDAAETFAGKMLGLGYAVEF
ncbi:MAG: hypothetical protein IJ389_04135 [Clostridia bacterium]|nr:hypothetical protein [Clostridia bacterium]